MARNDTIPPTEKTARLLIRITWHTFRVICSAQTYPPPWVGSPRWYSNSLICKLLAAFLRSSFVFARSLQHFWLPASPLLGTCYLSGDLRSTHTPSKYLRATSSHTHICFVSTASISCLPPVYTDHTTSVEHIPYLPCMSIVLSIPYLSYLL